jgi:hypothetical protein
MKGKRRVVSVVQLPQSYENSQAKQVLNSVISRAGRADSTLGSPIEISRGRELGRSEWGYAGFSTMSSWDGKKARTRDMILPSLTWERDAEASSPPQVLLPESPTSKARAQRRWQQASSQHQALHVPSPQTAPLQQCTALQTFVTAFESVAELVELYRGHSKRIGTGKMVEMRQWATLYT